MPHREADSYYRQLCEHLGMAVISTDTDLNIRTWNAAAARIFGATVETMIGTSVVNVIPQDRRRDAERLLRRTIAKGETIQFEFSHRGLQGEPRELACNIAPVVSDEGVRTGASVCVRDITRRIVLEDELHESRKMAALGEMASAVAHHFNNILGGVVTGIDYAEASDDPVIQRRMLAQIGPALQRAVALVNGLLAFSEGDPRAQDLSDLTETINALADELDKRLEGTGITFALAIPPLPVIPVPRKQLTTIVHNMVENAIEAMSEGGELRLDVSVGQDAIVLLIEDTGCGLSNEAKAHIFEPFWSTKGVLSSGDRQSAGLGLAIAHGLVQRLRGTVSVTSEVGRGASFRVSLPISLEAL